jgi:hypothetical protein
MLGFGCKLGPSSSHAKERCAEFGCFRGLSEAQAGFRMPSASHWIDGHLTLPGSPLTARHSILESGCSQAGCRAVQRSQEQTARRSAAGVVS